MGRGVSEMGEALIDPLRPSAALTDRYAKRLDQQIEAMGRDVTRAVAAAYRQSPPEQLVVYGQDVSPAVVLQRAVEAMGRKWSRRFDTLADQLARYFAQSVLTRNDKVLREQMRKAGFTVKFRMTRAMNDAYQAVRAENVALIKSIPEQHMTGVSSLVNQSVQTGRDLGTLTAALTKRTGITKRRAAFIARDQNSKATAVLQRARWLEMGITRARWLHSAGGKEPRPEHVAFSGQIYDVATGHDFNNGEGVVWPGTAINCRCVARPVIPGLDD